MINIVEHRSSEGAKAAYYQGADGTDPRLLNWNPPRQTPDQAIPELETLRSRAEDIARNSGLAASAQEVLLDNIGGHGVRIVPTPDAAALGWSMDQADEWAGQVNTKFVEYWGSTQCDLSGRHTGTDLSRLTLQTVITGGDCLALAHWLPDRFGGAFTRFQLVGPDRLAQPFGIHSTTSPTMRGGIELNPITGEPVAYHVLKSDPREFAFGGGVGSERIPAWIEWQQNGQWVRRRRVIYVADDANVIDQHRGVSMASPALATIKQLDLYVNATLKAAATMAMICAFVEHPMGSMETAQMFGADPASDKFKSILRMRQAFLGQLSPGSMITLFPGDKVTPMTPGADVSETFGPFVKLMLKTIASGGYELPLEMATRDWTDSTYSSARATLSQAQITFQRWRDWLTRRWFQPVYELWLEEQINRGLVEAPDFYGKRAAYSAIRTMYPGKGWIDSKTEVAAAGERMRLGLSSLAMECAEQGVDWRDIARQQSQEQIFKARLRKEREAVMLAEGLSEPDPADDPADPADPADDSAPEQPQKKKEVTGNGR